MDAAASARDGAGRAGSPCEPVATCGRAALLGFVSPVSFRLRRQGRENCGEMAGRAYGKTVWSWPSLLRSSLCGGVCEPNRADSIIQIREAREARRKVRLPGEHGISRPTIAQGRPSDWLHLYAAVRFSCVCFSRGGPRVPAGTRPSLCPLGQEGEATKQSSGECAARMRRCVCDSNASWKSESAAPCSVIASAAKQSSLPPRSDSGLLRCARNDAGERMCATLHSRAPGPSAAPLQRVQDMRGDA